MTSEYGTTAAGGDYYYTAMVMDYFIVSEYQQLQCSRASEQLIEEAVEANPDAAWRIVTIHQDIYGIWT